MIRTFAKQVNIYDIPPHESLSSVFILKASSDTPVKTSLGSYKKIWRFISSSLILPLPISFLHTVRWFESPTNELVWLLIKQCGRGQKKHKRGRGWNRRGWDVEEKKNRCLPEVTQWFYAFSLCFGWAVVHLLHQISPSTTRQICERMSCAARKKTLLLPLLL